MTTAIFEARILIKSPKPVRYHSWKDGEEYEKTIKTIHIERRTREQAEKYAQKYASRYEGATEILSCKKIDRDVIIGTIEGLPIQNEIYVKTPTNAITMDEMPWKLKGRSRRRYDYKDKKRIE